VLIKATSAVMTAFSNTEWIIRSERVGLNSFHYHIEQYSTMSFQKVILDQYSDQYQNGEHALFINSYLAFNLSNILLKSNFLGNEPKVHIPSLIKFELLLGGSHFMSSWQHQKNM